MEEVLSNLLKNLIPGLSIDKPIMSARLKGNNLELFLYGGEHLIIPIPDATLSGVAPATQSQGPALSSTKGPALSSTKRKTNRQTAAKKASPPAGGE